MKRRHLSLAITLVTGCAIGAVMLMGPAGAPSALADSSYHNLAASSLTQDWSNTSQFTTNDNWNGVPSIVGYNGADPNGALDNDPCSKLSNPFGSLAVAVISGDTFHMHPSTLTSRGVARFMVGPGSEVSDVVVGIRGSSDFDAPFLLFHLNATGRQNINVQFDAEDLDHSGNNALSKVAVQYRVGNTGPFINVHCTGDVTQGPNLKGTFHPRVNVTLPAGANNQSQLQVRVMTYNAVSNPAQGHTSADEWIGIDNIVISSSAGAGPTPTNTQPGPTATNTQPGPTPTTGAPPTPNPALNIRTYLPFVTH